MTSGFSWMLGMSLMERARQVAGDRACAREESQSYREFMKVETETEDDGRWIAKVPALPGAMAYGSSRAEAVSKVEALVLRILAEAYH